jgi:CelD/BcsL family acetyltransferase involved in cellulose biosynthesis
VFDEKGWLALYFLTVDNMPVATTYSFDYNLRKYGYLTGFNPDFGQYGVGNLLKIYMIEECIRKGFKEYDLTRGFESYKAEWATGVRKNFVVKMVNKGWRAPLRSWIEQIRNWPDKNS